MTIVLFVRHEAPRDGEEKPVVPNTLNKPSRDRAFRTGHLIFQLGYTVEAWASSPQGRAVETGLHLMAGNSQGKGPIPLSMVSPALGDLLLGGYPFPSELKDQLMLDAKTAGVGPEHLLLTEEKYADMIMRRGVEGAAAMRNFLGESEGQGQVVAVTSHGGSRIEPTLWQLSSGRNVELKDIPEAAPGSVYILRFDGVILRSSLYLGVIADQELTDLKFAAAERMMK